MGSQITMLKLRGWSGLTNNYVKTEAEAGEGSQITMLKLRGWTGLTNNASVNSSGAHAPPPPG